MNLHVCITYFSTRRSATHATGRASPHPAPTHTALKCKKRYTLHTPLTGSPESADTVLYTVRGNLLLQTQRAGCKPRVAYIYTFTELALKKIGHTQTGFLSKAVAALSLSRLDKMHTCAEHTQYCDRTTSTTPFSTLPRSTPHTHASSQRGGPSLLYAPPARSPTSMPPVLVNICMSPVPLPSSTCHRIRVLRRRCAASPHEREVVGRWVAPVARSARYGARVSGFFRRAGCCSRPAAARRARAPS